MAIFLISASERLRRKTKQKRPRFSGVFFCAHSRGARRDAHPAILAGKSCARAERCSHQQHAEYDRGDQRRSAEPERERRDDQYRSKDRLEYGVYMDRYESQ